MKRRILKFSSFVILIMCFVLLSSTNVFASEEIEDEYLFETINLETREIETFAIPEEIIEKAKEISNMQNSMENEGDPRAGSVPRRAIIGMHDERKKVENTKVFPYCAIALLEATWPNGEVTQGTAFMTSPKRALTAGHCIYDLSKGGYAAKVVVYPGMNGISNKPFGSATAYELSTSKAYRSAAEAAYNGITEGYNTNMMKEDYGILRFENAIGDKTGYMDLRYYSDDASLAQKYCYSSGYPGDYPYYQYMASSTIRDNDEKSIRHHIDTMPGQSGSPIYEIDSDGSMHVIAIYVAEDPKDVSTRYNYGKRINYTIQYLASFPN